MTPERATPPHQNQEPARSGALSPATALLVAFLSGGAVMVVELGAARLVAPFFGQSLYVWTNVIATVLAALAAGNFLGGRAADAWPSRRVLAALLAVAGVLCVGPPLCVPWIARALLPSGLELEFAFPFLSLGSLVTALCAFAPAVLVLGSVLPFLIKLCAPPQARLGSVSGRVYGASTAGSIAGTFLASYVLIAWFGVRIAFLAAAGVLFLCALVVVGSAGVRRRRTAVVAVALASLGGGALVRPPAEAGVVLAVDTPYQYLRVRRVPDEHAVKLELNEGLDSFQSLLVEGEVLTGGQYYDYFTLLPLLARDQGSLRVLILGLAGGTIARQLLAVHGDRSALAIDGVELDPAVVAAGYEYLALPRDPRLTVYSGVDARSFLQLSRQTYDLIVVDAYAQQAYIPFHLSTVEFFGMVRDHLAPRGLVAINVGAYSREDAVLAAIGATLARVFGKVLCGRIPQGRNQLVYASRDGDPRHPSTLDPGDAPALVRPLLAQLQVAGRVVALHPRADDRVLTDDHAPIELLHDRDQRRRSTRFLREAGG